MHSPGTKNARVAPYTDYPLGLSFRPALRPGATRLTVHVNDTAYNGTSEIADTPKMVVGGLPTKGRKARPATAVPVAAKDSTVAENGTEARIDGLSFTQNRIGAAFTITNGGEDPSVLAGGEQDDTYAVDDLGNRLHPAARQLTVKLNSVYGGTSVISEQPQFTFGPFDVGGKATVGNAETPLPEPLAVNRSKNHANGTQLRVEEFEFGPDTTTAKISFDNGTDETQSLNRHDDTKLYDEDGGEYPLLPPDRDKDLTVSPGKRLDADLVFSGRIHEDATSVRLAVNDVYGGTSVISEVPEFGFGPYRFERPTGEAAKAPGFAVGLRSDLANRELGSSKAREVARTVSKYDGKKTKDGVRLTVPEHVLFDFDSSKLRPDGRGAVRELADVLRYYGNAPATVAGYTDSVGGSAYNERLSTKRASSVRQALVDDHGIAASRLAAEGRGEANPVARNTNPDGSDNPQGRQKNRRVVLEIKTDKGLPR